MRPPGPTHTDPLAVNRAPWRRLAALYRVRLRPGWRQVRPLLVLVLSEADRDKDREPVRQLPEMLAEVGFELYRTDPARAPALERPAT
jgi:hypothetical protein